MIWNQPAQFSRYFGRAPRKDEVDMATAKKLAAVELRTNVSIARGADVIVKGWAIGILDPRTQFNEDYTNAFLDSFFKGKLGIVVLIQIALQEGGQRL